PKKWQRVYLELFTRTWKPLTLSKKMATCLLRAFYPYLEATHLLEATHPGSHSPSWKPLTLKFGAISPKRMDMQAS
ncbi:MAG: hypothetical protein QNK37_39085, partial [Acidobacteriota bacterium]|nr:hypothetical protein [Acidobacteriota bacterium]